VSSSRLGQLQDRSDGALPRRAQLGMCRWYDCEKPEGTTLLSCACHAPNIRYCSPECQK